MAIYFRVLYNKKLAALAGGYTRYEELEFFDNTEECNLIWGLSPTTEQKEGDTTEEDYYVTYWPLQQTVVQECSGLVDIDGTMLIPQYIQSHANIGQVKKGRWMGRLKE